MTFRSDEIVRLEVPPDGESARVDKYLATALEGGGSRTFFQGLIESGLVKVNGANISASSRVRPGDRIDVTWRMPVSEVLQPEELSLDVIYEDESLAVINKPAGLLVHPGPSRKTGTLVGGLLHLYPEVASVGTPERPGLVHRLDRDTSGVMVIARTESARENLVSQFKGRSVEKEYRAILVGDVRFDSDFIDLPLGRDPRFADRMRVDSVTGKPSSTFYEVLERFDGFTLAAVKIFTGRTHQIRVHFSHIGFPIAGDQIYGRRGLPKLETFFRQLEEEGKVRPTLARQALHSRRLVFEHPIRGERLEFVVEVPDDMREILDVLRASV